MLKKGTIKGPLSRANVDRVLALIQRIGVKRTWQALGVSEQTLDAARSYGASLTPGCRQRIQDALDRAEAPAMLGQKDTGT